MSRSPARRARPSRLRKDLPKLALRDAFDPAGAVEHNGPRARRALIEGEDVRHLKMLAEF